MLSDEIKRYEALTGENALEVPISRIGGYLDGYEQGRAESARHGRWKNLGNDIYECSECGQIVVVAYKWCYGCGAKMDED